MLRWSWRLLHDQAVKGYVVTLLNIAESVEIAKRAVESAAQFGIDACYWPGVWRDDAIAQMQAEGLRAGKWDQSWSNTNAVIGNFVAQYRIWKEIAAAECGAMIFEHDAVVVGRLPNLAGEGDIITLGKPSFGTLRPRQSPGFYPLFSYGDKIPGAHGYYLTPGGAASLVAAARRDGAMPVDKFICPQRFDIREYWPWPIEAHDSFTTIQKEKGCRSKHSYRRGAYRIL